MEHLINDISILLVGTAVLSIIAVLLKQPIIIAYILCGIFIGPWGSGWVENTGIIEILSHLGITLLLFLAGLNLHPGRLFELFKKSIWVTFTSSLFSFVVAFLIATVFGFHLMDSICIGLALMFSSTILTVKLLPTTTLHHARIGAVCIGVLILQDLLAVAVLAFLRCLSTPETAIISFVIISLKLVLFIVALVLLENFVLRKIMHLVERLHEVIFVLGLAWCFGIASISNSMGLFHETGAFFAGVVVARHPISRFIADELKTLRDFFLVLFFFTLGAKLDLFVMKEIILPALILAMLFILLKPWVFAKSLIIMGEKETFAKEAGLRLGQLSEFSLLIALLGLELDVISLNASQLIQLSTILTFVVSSYIVVFKLPTPIGISENLIRN